VELWQQCVELLRDELPAQQFNTWIRPLQVEAEGDELRVYAPNRFVLDWVNEKYLGRVLELLGEHGNGIAPALSLLIGSRRSSAPRAAPNAPVAPPRRNPGAQQAQQPPDRAAERRPSAGAETAASKSRFATASTDGRASSSSLAVPNSAPCRSKARSSTPAT
jgi:chromosomal replication initiator protein